MLWSIGRRSSIVGIYETFTKRLRRRERAGEPDDVYQYTDLPQPLRVQIIHIWGSAIGPSADGAYATVSAKVWTFVHDTLAREMGVFYLGDEPYVGSEEKCKRFLLRASTEEALDLIELSFRAISQLGRWVPWNQRAHISQKPESAVAELNHRFREHGVGYQFVENEIVRVDSQYVHAKVIKPAISLLNTAGFDGPSSEFLKAHEHYRKGMPAEAMNEALKAFESTMKAICSENGWGYPGNATAKTLINVVLEKELVPRYMETHLAGLRNTLEAGLPTVRNKNSGHGQGAQAREVPEYFAGYALHLAATNIVFLVEAHQSLNK